MHHVRLHSNPRSIRVPGRNAVDNDLMVPDAAFEDRGGLRRDLPELKTQHSQAFGCTRQKWVP